MLNITLLKGKRGILAVAEYYKESRRSEKEVSEYYSEKEKRDAKIYNSDKFNVENESVENILIRYSSHSRIAYDLTYSASKSVSIAKYVIGDKNIDDAWNKAVERIISEVNERTYTRRRYKDLHVHEKADALFLTFQHDLSRERDPQLHTHIVVPAKVRRASDGKYTSLSNEKIFKDKTLIDMIGNYELAYQLQQRGIKVHFEKDNVELTGINQTVKDIFSKRRKQIEEKLKELGISKEEISRSFYDYIKRATRREKEEVGQLELDEFWEQQLKQIGYTREKIREEYEKANREFQQNKKTLSKEEEKELLKRTLTDLHEQYSLIDETTLQKEYLKRIFAKVNEENLELTDYDSFKQRFNENIKELQRENFLHVETYTLGSTSIRHQYFYTEQQKQIELSNLKKAKELANKQYIHVDEKEIEQEIKKFQQEKGFRLTKEQSDAVYRILDSKSSILVVEGSAGAGKTTSMEVVRSIADRKNINVIGLAPTGKAGEELSKTLGNGETIDSFILKVRNRRVDEGKLRRSLIIVDEAGMVSAKKANELLKFASKTDSKIVFIGDTKQFQSISAGAVLRDLKNAGIPYCRLSEIRRQKDVDYLMITKSLSAKDFKTAYSKLFEKDLIQDFDSKEQAIKQLVDKFDKDTLIVVNDNKTKDVLNTEIRAKLGMKDEIIIKSEVPKNVQKKDLINADKYERGDIVNLRSNRRGVVIDVNKERNTVLLEITGKNGERELKEYKASELQRHVRSIVQRKEKGLAVGDRIITLKNSKEFGVKNGELFEIKQIDRENNRIRIVNDRKDVWLDLNRYRNVDHAYAITTYKSQGMTVDKVKFYANKTNYNEFYVAMTRGRQSAEIYTTDVIQLLYTAQRTAEKDSILSKANNNNIAFTRDELAKWYFNHLKTKGEVERFKKYLNHIDNIDLKRKLSEEVKMEKHRTHYKELNSIKPITEEKQEEQELKQEETRQEFRTIAERYASKKEKRREETQEETQEKTQRLRRSRRLLAL
jgi:conjugative relaxase-like TrwC/TraI family protein